MTYDVILTEPARQKILEQATFIARERQEPEAAARWLQRVLKAGNTLETMPERCERAEEDAYFPYDVRALKVGSFMLLYTVVEETMDGVGRQCTPRPPASAAAGVTAEPRCTGGGRMTCKEIEISLPARGR